MAPLFQGEKIFWDPSTFSLLLLTGGIKLHSCCFEELMSPIPPLAFLFPFSVNGKKVWVVMIF